MKGSPGKQTGSRRKIHALDVENKERFVVESDKLQKANIKGISEARFTNGDTRPKHPNPKPEPEPEPPYPQPYIRALTKPQSFHRI